MARPETSTLWSFPAASENISVFNLPLSPGFSPPIRMFHMLDTPQIGHFSITDSSLVAVVLIQKSIVKSLVPKLPAVLPKLIWLLTPLKSNACPTMPSVNEMPVKEPLSVPTRSLPLPLPGHQLTRPDGGGTHPELGVTDTLSSNTSTATVAEEVSVNVKVELLVVAVNVNVC